MRSRHSEVLVNLACDILGVGVASAVIAGIVFYFIADSHVEESKKFAALRPGLERQCREMLNMGNQTFMVQSEAKKFNTVLADYQRTLQHPIGKYTVSGELVFVKPLTCGLE